MINRTATKAVRTFGGSFFGPFSGCILWICCIRAMNHVLKWYWNHLGTQETHTHVNGCGHQLLYMSTQRWMCSVSQCITCNVFTMTEHVIPNTILQASMIIQMHMGVCIHRAFVHNHIHEHRNTITHIYHQLLTYIIRAYMYICWCINNGIISSAMHMCIR